MFGQSHAAQRHLENHCVGVGDIFLFFGWFREVEQRDGQYRFKRGARDRHVFLGGLRLVKYGVLLKTGSMYPIGQECIPTRPQTTGQQIQFTSQGALILQGTFPRVTPELVLTRDGLNRSSWRLPKWFDPSNKRSCLSYHSNLARWQPLDAEYVSLTSVGRGQEFVLDTAHYPEAEMWARGLIEITQLQRLLDVLASHFADDAIGNLSLAALLPGPKPE